MSLESLGLAAMPYVVGFGITLQLTVITTFAAFALAVPQAIARLSPWFLVRWPATAYSAAVRGTPQLVQIFMVYYGLPQIGIIRHTVLWSVFGSAYSCAIIAFTLNMTAYLGEVVRAGIQNVSHGQIEAARACGMGPWTLYRRILLPGAFRLILPALSSEVVIQLKSTALASVITVFDLTGVARRQMAQTYSTDPLLIAGAVYVLLTFAIAGVFQWLETQTSPHRQILGRR